VQEIVVHVQKCSILQQLHMLIFADYFELKFMPSLND